MRNLKGLLCMLLAFTMILPCMAITALAINGTESEEKAKSTTPGEYVLYQEDFDDVTGTVALDAGNNMSGAAKGWIYTKNSETGSVKIENGRMYISGNLYDVVYRDGGETWGNYSLEADFCYTEDNKNWGGMLFNVQSGYKFQKVGIGPGKVASINGYDNGWTNDNKSINHWDMSNDPSLVIPQNGDPFRMKVTVFNKSATLYYAMLNTDGSLKTDFIQIMSISNIPADAQTGSIGFMLPGYTTEWGSYWVDNIKCYSDTLVSYTEDFDSYSDVTLTADSKNTAMGVYYDKNFSTGTAYLENGKLYLSGGGKNFDAIFFNMGKNWTNYAFEADITYTAKETGWAGLLFRSTDIDNFQKAALTAEKRGCLNGQYNGSWYNDKEGVSKLDYSAGKVATNVASRLRVETNENSAALYVAYYDKTTGKRGDWELVMKISDNFAKIHMSGTIGFIVGGGTNSKTCSICVDNITVSRIEGADRMASPPNVADIYKPVTGIVNPPVVVQELTDTLPNANGERAAVVMAELDANMNVLKKGGTALTTASSFIDTYRDVLIPAFIVDSEAEATALAALIQEKELVDCYVVADQQNAALVKKVRLANDTTALISGALIFDDLNSAAARKAARALVSDNMSYVAISKAPLSEESAFYFALRQVAAWSYATDKASVYKGIANGYHGIVSTDVSSVYDVYESITETTVSGRPVIIAHRGANDKCDVAYPENTLMAFRAAKEIYGADAIELDFGLSKDGYAILMHDNTVDRTTNGTGNFSNLTLAELKALKVDYVSGKSTEIPTLEEAIQLAIELDIVLYCHVKTNTSENIAAFSYLVDKYDAHDRVLLFGANISVYHSNNESVVSSSTYGFENQAVVTDGIGFSAGNQKILEGLSSHLDGVDIMRKTLTKYNYQPLFYQYSKQGSMWGQENFYYQLAARGFVNTHSITDGLDNMAETALTVSGAVGYLTNNLQYSKDYCYKIDLSSEELELNVGEKISSQKALIKIAGKTNLNIGVIQLAGPQLTEDDGKYTLNTEGTVTVVYYSDISLSNGESYRIYSEPVSLTFKNEVKDAESTTTQTPDVTEATTPPTPKKGCASFNVLAVFVALISLAGIVVLKKK